MLALSIAVVALLIASLFVFQQFQNAQEAPYMDEIFHIPQAKQYCSLNFSYWDPMITTLPGLYLSSLLILSPLAAVKSVSLVDVCTTRNLRACNLLYCCGNFVLLYLLSKHLDGRGAKEKKRLPQWNVLRAITLSVMPVSYFFTCLYYTDPGSTFFTLLTYFLCLRGQRFASSLSGSAAILFRQTNVIWVFFCLCLTAVETVDNRLRLDKKVANWKRLSDWQMMKVYVRNVFSGFGNFFSLLIDVLFGTFWYVLIICCFLVFVVMNKGIVVGDRTHHTVSTNFPQVFYFLLVSSALSFPHIARPGQVRQTIRFIFHHPLKVVVFILVSCWLIQYFTYEHKYLLSDNRHYTFYVWSKIFRRHKLVKFALIPAYFYGFYQFVQATIEKGFLWRVAIFICTALCLIPQALLEFRYFIIPFYIVRLNMKSQTPLALAIELALAISVNIFTAFMFTQKPFYWPDDPNPQRFMW